MDMDKIKAVEALVEEIADYYEEPDDEIVVKFNDLTGNDWDAETYFEYCCEYYSHHSLEQTVCALLNGGRYPDDTEAKVCDEKELVERFAQFYEYGFVQDIDQFKPVSFIST